MVTGRRQLQRHKNRFRGAPLGRAPVFALSARERSLCLAVGRVLIRRLEEVAQLGAHLLVVLVPVHRGGVLGGGLHHLVFLANDHQRAIRSLGQRRQSAIIRAISVPPSGRQSADPPVSDDRRQARRRHGQHPEDERPAGAGCVARRSSSIRRRRSRPRASRGQRAGVSSRIPPGSGRLCGTTAWRRRPSCPGFLSPFGCRRSLLASCSRRDRSSSRSAHRSRPGGGAGPRRVTAFRTHELRPGWVSSKPRGRRCSSRTEGRAQPAPAALPRPVLRPVLAHPSCGLPFARHQRGFTRFTRPVCPSPVAAGMERPPLGFPRGFTPRR